MRLYPLSFDDQMSRLLRHDGVVTPSGLIYDDYHAHLDVLFGDKPVDAFAMLKNPIAAKELASNALTRKHQNLLTKDFIESGAVDRMLDTISPDLLGKIITEGLRLFHFRRDLHHHRWMKCGSRIYTLSPELVSAFENVEMNYPVSSLNFPFSEFFLQFDHDPLFSKTEGQLDFAGVYVSAPYFMRDVIKDGLVNVSIGSRSVNIDFTDSTNSGVIFDLLICGWSDNPDEGSGFADRVELRENKNAEEAIVDSFSRHGALSEHNMDQRLRIYRVVLNTIMYMSSVDPDVVVKEVVSRPPKSGGKKKNKKKRVVFSKFRRTKVSYLGSRLETRVERKSPVGHMRRGHPRWQPCGKGNSQRKLIFVKPTWVKGRKSDVVHVTRVERDQNDNHFN